MLRILHTSDLHIGSTFKFLKEKSQNHKILLKQSLINTVNYAIENNIDLFLIAGDIFDVKYPSKQSIDFLIGELNRLIKNKIYVVIIPGNHDYNRKEGVFFNSFNINNEYFKILNSNIVDKHIIEDLNCNIIGYTQLHSDGDKYLKDINVNNNYKYNIALIHASIDINNNNLRAIPRNFFDKSNFDYIALGDWHNTLKINNRTYYSGSLEVLSVDQKDKGGFLIITLDNKNIKVEKIEIGKINVLNIDLDLTSVDDNKSVINKIKLNKEENTILNIKFLGIKSINIDIDYIKEEIINDFYYIIIKDKSLLKLSPESLMQYSNNLLIKNYIEYINSMKTNGSVDEDIASKAIQLGVRLLKGELNDN